MEQAATDIVAALHDLQIKIGCTCSPKLTVSMAAPLSTVVLASMLLDHEDNCRTRYAAKAVTN